MVQRTYGAMTNDVLISIPLFVLMGYVMERGALVDKMFYSIQLAFRRVPASLAVATLIVCTFWGIASGLVGAVVVLMGVIAFNPMLKAGYDVKLAAGVITAGGTLGILIPPSVMIIVYAAVAGQSVVKLYAAAMFPGLLPGVPLSRLHHRLGADQSEDRAATAGGADPRSGAGLGAEVPAGLFAQHARRRFCTALVSPAQGACHRRPTASRSATGTLLKNFVYSLVPFVLIAAHAVGRLVVCRHPPAGGAPRPRSSRASQQLGTPGSAGSGAATPAEHGPAHCDFYMRGSARICACFIAALVHAALLLAHGRPSSFEVLKLLTSSVMPLGILTVVVLAVILFGITTATESAAVGAAGAFLLAFQARTLDWKRTKEAVFLTAKTTAMVCWLFVGSALFSAVFAILGGQALLESWVLSLNLTPLQFMILSQAIIFILGWPLEWTEIIVIFVPIFLPMLKHFDIDPILWGVLVFVNLQAAFLSPPVAMSAFYLKGVAPSHVTLNQIFAGMMPYMLIVILCMVIMYIWPGMTLWLPNYLYGN